MSAPQFSATAEPFAACHADTFAGTSSIEVYLRVVPSLRVARSIASSAPLIAHQARSIGNSPYRLRHGSLASSGGPICGGAIEHEPSHNIALKRTRAGGAHLGRFLGTRRAVARRLARR